MTEQSMPPDDGLSLFRPAGEGPWRTDPRGLGLLGSLGQPHHDDGEQGRRLPRWQFLVAGLALAVSAVWLLVVVAGLFLGLPARTQAGPPASPVPEFPALQPTSAAPMPSTSAGDPTPSLTPAASSPTSPPSTTTKPAATSSTAPARPTSTRRAAPATTRRPVTTARPRPTATTPAPPRTTAPALDPRFRNCQAAISAGYGPYYAGRDPEYAWYPDRDGNGVVCDKRRGRPDNGDG